MGGSAVGNETDHLRTGFPQAPKQAHVSVKRNDGHEHERIQVQVIVVHSQMHLCYVIIVRGCIDAVWLLFDDFSEISVWRKTLSIYHRIKVHSVPLFGPDDTLGCVVFSVPILLCERVPSCCV